MCKIGLKFLENYVLITNHPLRLSKRGFLEVISLISLELLPQERRVGGYVMTPVKSRPQ